MAFKPGWLNRQFQRVEDEVAQWPDSMKRAAGFTDLSNSKDQRIAELEKANLTLCWTIKELEMRQRCTVCCGQPLPSGRQCICKDVGTIQAENEGLREWVVEMENRLNRIEAQL